MTPFPQDESGKKRKAVIGTAFAAGTLVCCAAVVAVSRAQLGKNEWQTPQTEPVPFAAVPPPRSPSNPQEFLGYRGYRGRVAPVPGAPMSRVRQDESGSSDSTRAVNFITSAAPLNRGGSDAWLGTQYGVKRVWGKSIRYYTTSDGLPGDYVEAAAADENGTGAWCLVRSSKAGDASRPMVYDGGNGTQNLPPLVFCAWNSKTDTWRTVHDVPTFPLVRNYGYTPPGMQSSKNLEAWQGKSVIANSAQYVCFAPRFASPKAEAIAYIWDKKTEKVQAIAWKPGLLDSKSQGLGISFLHMDEPSQTLWMGTSEGLLTYHLPDGAWRTFLPDRAISTGTVSSDKTVLFVTARLPDDALPPPPDRSNRSGIMPGNVPPQSGEPPIWRLFRVDLPSGETGEMPPPPSTSSPYGWSPFNGGFSGNIPNEPSGLFVDDKKNVWATITPPITYFGGEVEAGGIDRFDATQKTWQHIALAPPYDPRQGVIFARRRPGSEPVPLPPGINPPPVAAPTPDPVLVLLDTVPSGALIPLTLSDNSRGSDPYRDEYYGYSGGNSPTFRPAYWIRHRFPAWYGPADAEAQEADNPYNPRPAVSDDSTPGGDPVWIMQNPDTLASVPRADLKPNEGVNLLGTGGYRTVPLTSPHVETFPLKASFPTLRAPVLRLVSASSPQNPGLVLVQDTRSLFLVDTNKSSWSEVVLPDVNNGSTSASGSSLVANLSETGSPLLQKTNSSAQQVRMWNPVSKTFEMAAALPVPPNGRLLGAGLNGAAWFFTNNGPYTLWYQKPAAPGSAMPPAPLRVVPTPPTEWTLSQYQNGMQNAPQPLSVQGSRAWYVVRVRADFFELSDEQASGRSNISDRESLAGYDALTQKWTLPLPLQRNTSDKVALLTVQNRTFAATTAGNPNGSVWEWSDLARKWLVVAPPLPPEPGLFDSDDYPLRRPVVPVAINEKYVWVFVLGRMMARYDRVGQKWQSFPLPPALRDKPETYYDNDRQPKVVQTGPNSFCVGSEKGGLWRFRVGAASPKSGAAPAAASAAVWEPVGRQVGIQSRPKGVARVSPEFTLSNVTVTPHYVWAMGYHQSQQFAFAARFDKAAKTWTVLDERTGFPMHDHFSDVVPDGDSVWVTGGSGTYRFDPKANRWMLMLRGNDSSVRASENALVSPAVKSGTSPVGSVAKMAADDKSVYFLFRVPPQTREATQARQFATILWRWDKSTQMLQPLTLPGVEGSASRRTTPAGSVLLNEPGVVWVGTSSGLFAWDKAKEQGREMTFPPSIPFVAPQRIVRKGDALVVIGSGLVRDNGSSYSGTPHVVRLVGPDFLKRP